jgi:N-acetylmuramoyl-L-alanine amidase
MRSDSNVRDRDLIKKIAQADKSLNHTNQRRLFKKSYTPAHGRSCRRQKTAEFGHTFIVLIGANMPSVLAEVAFNNPKVERLLRKESTEQSLVKAVHGYRRHMKTLETTSL